jgi:hypothetical protein
MRLGESINTYDPALALRGERGNFLVKTPGGEELMVTCEPGQTFGNIRWHGHQNQQPFLVTKISEAVTLKGITPITEAA